MLACGYVAKGSVREANGKVRLHMKVCEYCKMSNASSSYDTAPSFDKEAALNNGWNGVSAGKKVDNIMMTAEINQTGLLDRPLVEINDIRSLIDEKTKMFEKNKKSR